MRYFAEKNPDLWSIESSSTWQFK